QELRQIGGAGRTQRHVQATGEMDDVGQVVAGHRGCHFCRVISWRHQVEPDGRIELPVDLLPGWVLVQWRGWRVIDIAQDIDGAAEPRRRCGPRLDWWPGI